MKKIIIFILTIYYSTIFSQVPSDALFMFKTCIYMDKSLLKGNIDNNEGIKDSFNYFNYLKNIYLNPDTLKSNIYKNFVFLAINPNDSLQFNCSNDFCSFLMDYSKPVMNKRLIFCFDKHTGRNYRIAGFNQSDLDGFWEAIHTHQDFLKLNRSKRVFLKHYWIESIDLKCLFDSMGKEYNSNKYPCTYRNSDNMMSSY